MPLRLIIFDFDGTLTDIGREGDQFEAAYEGMVLRIFGQDRREAWRTAIAGVRADAPELGWDMGSGAAAPGDADPSIAATLALGRFCTELDLPTLSGEDPKARKTRGELGGALYQAAYGALHPAFREDTVRVLEAAMAAVPFVRVVTNSSTAKVTEKLRPLGLSRPIGVAGDARKFEISEPTTQGFGIGGVGSVWQVPGLRRPIQPRRGRYFDVLADVWRDTGTTPQETLVVGDIVELDLVLPGLLGASVHYVARERTHSYESAILRAFGEKATMGRALSDVLTRLG